MTKALACSPTPPQKMSNMVCNGQGVYSLPCRITTATLDLDNKMVHSSECLSVFNLSKNTIFFFKKENKAERVTRREYTKNRTRTNFGS
jgi:hypothetical protein